MKRQSGVPCVLFSRTRRNHAATEILLTLGWVRSIWYLDAYSSAVSWQGPFVGPFGSCVFCIAIVTFSLFISDLSDDGLCIEQPASFSQGELSVLSLLFQYVCNYASFSEIRLYC